MGAILRNQCLEIGPFRGGFRMNLTISYFSVTFDVKLAVGVKIIKITAGS